MVVDSVTSQLLLLLFHCMVPTSLELDLLAFEMKFQYLALFFVPYSKKYLKYLAQGSKGTEEIPKIDDR